jgi:hypothetical protein
MAFSIKPQFFGSFKTNDNIVYNLEILAILYEQYEESDVSKKRLLRKPITVIIVSIIEAILFDFYFRINKHTIEGVSNIATDVMYAVRGKELDKFEKYIDNAKKHDWFEVGGTNFYEKLHHLREARNRVHIQNEKHKEPLDEPLVFREELKVSAEKCLEKVIKKMNEKHSRSEYHWQYMSVLELPWDEHLIES